MYLLIVPWKGTNLHRYALCTYRFTDEIVEARGELRASAILLHIGAVMSHSGGDEREPTLLMGATKGTRVRRVFSRNVAWQSRNIGRSCLESRTLQTKPDSVSKIQKMVDALSELPEIPNEELGDMPSPRCRPPGLTSV